MSVSAVGSRSYPLRLGWFLCSGVSVAEPRAAPLAGAARRGQRGAASELVGSVASAVLAGPLVAAKVPRPHAEVRSRNPTGEAGRFLGGFWVVRVPAVGAGINVMMSLWGATSGPILPDFAFPH